VQLQLRLTPACWIMYWPTPSLPALPRAATTTGVGGVVSGTMVLTYTVGSSAAVFNQTGVRNFCSSEDGVIHFESPAGQSTPVTTTAACQAFTVLQ